VRYAVREIASARHERRSASDADTAALRGKRRRAPAMPAQRRQALSTRRFAMPIDYLHHFDTDFPLIHCSICHATLPLLAIAVIVAEAYAGVSAAALISPFRDATPLRLRAILPLMLLFR